MPFYKPLKKESTIDRKRIIDGIKRLRNQFKIENFPEKKTKKSLILGTWNIRNFDDNRFNFGPRTIESFYYLAEIVSHYDILAVQEICENLIPLDFLMNILGNEYDYLVTDVTHSSLGGNRERLGFIYDKNKVKFKGVAGEVVLPDKMLISDVTTKKRQFARTPFVANFQSGWFKFQFSTVHIYFGSNSKNSLKYRRRVEEINAIANYLAKESAKSDFNQILVGDFNIKGKGSGGFNALEKNGFTVICNKKGSNRDQTKFYDQISFRSRKNELTLMEPERSERVFQYFDSVYRAEDFEVYKLILQERLAAKLEKANNDLLIATSKTKRKKAQSQINSINDALKSDATLEEYYDEWRSFQISDHLPLWIELEIDFSDQYLEYLSKNSF